MFERFVAFLDSIGGGSSGSRDESTPLQLASAAILFAVMDADGVRHEQELHALLVKAEAAEAEAVDFYRFTSVLVKLTEKERLHLLELIWEVVYADGELHELEDNLVWRIAELIGVDGRDRVELRRKVARAAGVAVQ